MSLPTVTGARQSVMKQKPEVPDRYSSSQSASDRIEISRQPQEKKKPGILHRLFGCFSKHQTSDSDAGQTANRNIDSSHHLRSSEKLMTSIFKKRTRKALRQIQKGGINLEGSSSGGFTPLQFAVDQGNKKVVQALLQAGVNAQERGLLSRAPIHTAITRNRLEVLKLLLASGKVDVNQTGFMKETPLHLSVSNYSTEYMRLLLQAGCDYNKRDNFNQTAVYAAAQLRKPAHLALLLEANADPNIPDTFGVAPLDMAAQSSARLSLTEPQIMSVKLLLQHGAKAGHKNPFYSRTLKGLAEILIFARQQKQPDTELINLLLAHPGVAEQEKIEIAAAQEENSLSSSI